MPNDQDLHSDSGPLKAVCILGPTGTGKTAAALALARRMPATVINFDSRQVYADFPLITAQPGPEERGVCPHVLYGFLPCAESIGAAAFASLAKAEIARAASQGRLPVLVGGTGLYLRALVRGLAEIPDVPGEIRETIARRMATEGPPALHAELAEADPEYAASVHPNNRQRVGRALEVFLATGKPFSRWHAEQAAGDGGQYLKAGVRMELQPLTPRLERRIEAMLAMGALDEARRALDVCPDTTAPGWTGIGCAELAAHILGKISLDEARTLWLKNTRAYAKRQITWFRKEPGITWFESGDADGLARFAAHEAGRRGVARPEGGRD